MNTRKQQFELTEELTKEYDLLPSELYPTEVTNVWVTKTGEVFSMRNGSLRKLKQAKRHGYSSVNVGKNYATHKLMESAGLIDTAYIFSRYRDEDMNIHHVQKVTAEQCNNHVSNLIRVPAKYHSLYNKIQDVLLIDDVCTHTDVIGAIIDMRLSIKSFKRLIKSCEPYMVVDGYRFYYVLNGERELHFAIKYH